MTRKLTQSEWADLSAWLDGELPADRAGELESLIASDDAWAAALADLRAIDEALTADPTPAPPAGIEQQVVEFVRHNTLDEDQLAELSAWMDGELGDADAARVARHVVTESAWRRAHEELRQVDDALDTFTAPPCPAELPGRIIAATTGRSYDWAGLRKTLVSAPAMVAAMVAVLLGVYLFVTGFSTPRGITPDPGSGETVVAENNDGHNEDAPPASKTDRVVQEELAGYNEAEQFAIINRDMIENYEVIENLDVLREMERLESQGDS